MNMLRTILSFIICIFFVQANLLAQCGSTGVDTGICYSNNSLQAIAVDICPSSSTEIITLSFTAGSKESCCDEVIVYSGASGSGTGGTEIYNSSANGNTFAGLSFTGSNSGECLSVYIDADGSSDCTSNGGVSPVYNTSCAPPPPPPLTTGNDCALSSPICAEPGSSFVAAPGVGNGNAETGVDFGCLISDEQNPSWWWFQMDMAGTLTIDITPLTPTDYDYAVWGPFATSDVCGAALGAPADCSYASGTAPEQMNITGASGEYFVLLVNDHSTSSVNYTLELNTASSGTTNCNVVSCAADAGTITQATTGMGTGAVGDGYVLCVDESITLTSNDDYVLPDPVTGEISELMYAIYTGAPPASPSLTDTDYSGTLWTGEDFLPADGYAVNGTGGGSSSLMASFFGANNTVWLVPVTVDDSDDNGNPNGVLGIDNNSDDCYDYGTPIQVTYLEPMTVANNSTACSWDVVLDGGAVEFAAFLGTQAEYTYSITPDATALANGAAAATGLSTTAGGTVAAPSPMRDGTYTIQVTEDGNGCTESFDIVLSSCPMDVSLSISDPCNCSNSITVGAVTYAQETITITPGTAPYSVTAITGLYNASGVLYTTTTATAAISGTTLVGYVPSDNTATYSITVSDNDGSSDSLVGGPCTACAAPCAADNGTLSISGN